MEEIKKVSKEESIELAKQLSKFVQANANSSFMAKVFDEKVREFLVNGASVEYDTMYIMNRLIEFNKIESLKAYIMAGADVNIADNWNCTPLYFAMLQRGTQKSNRTYRILLEAGAKTDIKNKMNSLMPTPKDVAKRINNLDDYEKRIFTKYFNITFNNDEQK